MTVCSAGVYILVMYLYFIIQYTLYAILLIVAGTAAGLEFFKRNNYGVPSAAVLAMHCVLCVDQGV
jgi:hypothetical protein